MRPAARTAQPTFFEQAEGKLVIGWDDQVRTEIPYRELRLACPCAGCVEEWSGKRTVDPANVPEGVHPLTLEPVGNYAVSITWSDGHSTGIYSWTTLRALGSR
ncbi:MAG TPA: DUF971 domain-containing protein [Myxococcales bacterium]|nr:DUF971 domain-containing protein [Myxococcales bacterium]